MSGVSPPLRFLALVIVGWVVGRGLYVGSERLGKPEQASSLAVAENGIRHRRSPDMSPPAEATPSARVDRASITVISKPAWRQASSLAAVATVFPGETRGPVVQPPPLDSGFRRGTAAAGPPAALPSAPIGVPLGSPPTNSRIAGSTWLFIREDGPAALAPGGMLGGSRAGATISYRLNRDAGRPLALSARIYAPLDALDGAEVAAGLEWRPIRGLPVGIIAERRQALGSRGRSAFSLLTYGGVSDVPVAGPVVADAYAQAGVVGGRSRDLFADGSVRLSLPVGAAKLGVGAWGAAQPGVERLDVGPSASIRILPGAAIVADWRFRIAGNAAPGSGPALTLAKDF